MSRIEHAVRVISEAMDGRDSIKRKNSTLLSLCGRKAWSRRLRTELQRAFEEALVYPRPRLVGTDFSADATVEFSRRPYSSFEPAMRFATERDLESFILQNYRRIPAFRGLKLVKNQRHTLYGSIIDILFREGRDGYVVCELELGNGKREVVAQLFEYMRQVRDERPASSVRGIIITGEPNDAQESLLRDLSRAQDFPVDWYCYRASLELVPMALVPGAEADGA